VGVEAHGELQEAYQILKPLLVIINGYRVAQANDGIPRGDFRVGIHPVSVMEDFEHAARARGDEERAACAVGGADVLPVRIEAEDHAAYIAGAAADGRAEGIGNAGTQGGNPGGGKVGLF
jgi:hypothetical protein